MFRDLLIRLRALLRRTTVERELDEELRFHRAQQLESYQRRGLSLDEARRRLGLEFGEVDHVKDECRDARGVSVIEHLLRDIRYGVRSLLRAPVFSVVSVLTLALGLGATTAMFSVVYGVLLQPLPYADPSALVVLHETTPKVGEVSVSYPNFLDWRAESRAFSSMSAVTDLELTLAGVGQPELIGGEAVSSNFFSLLGVRPLLGRDFAPDEDRAGTAPVALLTYGLWQTHFGGDRAVTGRTINLDGHPVTVIGVLPPDFRWGDSSSNIFEPIGVWLTGNATVSRGNRGDMVVVGRLAGETGIGQARTEMEAIAARLAHAYPQENEQFGVALRSIRDTLIGDTRPALLVLLGAVVCVLLIACANVANLCLIRGASRTREIALRIAIGASRGRIVSQLLVESAILATAGGLVGLAFAVGGLRGLNRLMPHEGMNGAAMTLNGAVLAFAALTVFASTFIFGFTPAVQAVRTNVQSDLQEGGRTGSASRRQQRWRRSLAVAEISLALVLLVGAGLMVRSLSRLLSVDSGVRTDHVLTISMSLRGDRYTKVEARRVFWQQVLDGAAGLPGVDAAALGTGVPLTGNHSRRDISIEGLTFPTGALPHPDVHVVSPTYATALGIRLIRGRVFADSDNEQAPRVAMINRSTADRFFAESDPVGRRIMMGRFEPGSNPSWITIVGVLADTRLYGLDNPSRFEIYLPLRQAVPTASTLILRSPSDEPRLLPAVRALVASIDPDLPFSDVATMKDLVDASMSTRRVTFVLLGLFSVLALTLAGIGIYGVMSYSVAQRTNEFGIRAALGARPRDVVKTIVAQGLAMAALGIVVGVAVALGVTRLMSTLLYGVSAVDPPTFLFVCLGVAFLAALACAIPAWRASRVNPNIALRTN